MAYSIQHLRDTTANWAKNDIVVPEGEIALEILADGNINGKIGNGTHKFSELPYSFGKQYIESAISMLVGDVIGGAS